MTKEDFGQCCGCDHKKVTFKNHCGHSEALYSLGVVGALFYFLQNAATLGAVLLGIGKAIFWPALVVFRILTTLQF